MRSVSTKVWRYGVVGFTAFLIDYGVTAALVTKLPLLVANTIGFITANVANFLMAHKWVFGHEWRRHRLLVMYLSVLGVSTVGLVLNNLVVWVSVTGLALPLLYAKVLASGLVMGWNFLARLLWVYRKRGSN
jgi:putative flippase GtrA